MPRTTTPVCATIRSPGWTPSMFRVEFGGRFGLAVEMSLTETFTLVPESVVQEVRWLVGSSVLTRLVEAVSTAAAATANVMRPAGMPRTMTNRQGFHWSPVVTVRPSPRVVVCPPCVQTSTLVLEPGLRSFVQCSVKPSQFRMRNGIAKTSKRTNQPPKVVPRQPVPSMSLGVREGMQLRRFVVDGSEGHGPTHDARTVSDRRLMVAKISSTSTSVKRLSGPFGATPTYGDS